MIWSFHIVTWKDSGFLNTFMNTPDEKRGPLFLDIMVFCPSKLYIKVYFVRLLIFWPDFLLLFYIHCLVSCIQP